MPLTKLELQLSLWAWYGRFSKTLQNGIIKWACKKYEVKKVKIGGGFVEILKTKITSLAEAASWLE